MTRRVNQVQSVLFAVECVIHLDCMALDGDATFLFKVHIVEHLSLRNLNRLGTFEQTVSQGTFTVVNMGDNAEIAYVIHLWEGRVMRE